MRVITEERLKEWLKHVDDLCLDDTFWIENDINQYMQEIDTLTVSKLRPISDAPKDGNDLLCVLHGSTSLVVAFYNGGLWEILGTDEFYNNDDVLGWIPMTTYKPE